MAKEIITLTDLGAIGTEMVGFQGKDCLKAAAEIAQELEGLGVVASLGDIRMKSEQLVVKTLGKEGQTIKRG